MNALEQLESLNPVPDFRGNPGVPTEHGTGRSRVAMLAGVGAAAAVILVLVVLTLGGRPAERVELDVADVADDPTLVAEVDETTAAPVASGTGPVVASSSSVQQVNLEASALVVARLVIPAINADLQVVQGVSDEALRLGVGHYMTTPWPGQIGNAAIAGHRTAYHAPFYRLDELATDESIYVTTTQGVFEYVVREHLIVGPDDVSVLRDFGDNRLTLTTGHPKYSNSERLVIVADLVGDPVPRRTTSSLPIAAELSTFEGLTPDISAYALTTTPFYSAFFGTNDALGSARAFVESQFGSWADQVALAVHEHTLQASLVRWSDGQSGTEGWITMRFGDGRYVVLNMTMDGVGAQVHQTPTGGRGLAQTDEAVMIEVLRPVRFPPRRESAGDLDTAAENEPLAEVTLEAGADSVTEVSFDARAGEQFQDVRLIIRNPDGGQIGAAAMSMALPPVNEVGVVTTIDETSALVEFARASAEVLAAPITLDRWQSAGQLSVLAPDLAPSTVDELPTRQLTWLALRLSADEIDAQDDFLEGLADYGVLVEPLAPQYTSEPLDRADAAAATGYVVDDLPTIDHCRGLTVGGWAPPVVTKNYDRTIFGTPGDARDSAPLTADGAVVEFSSTDGTVIGYSHVAADQPWHFLDLVVTEAVDGGWVLDRWVTPGC